MVVIKKRAVSPAQKALRRQQILGAAADMFKSQPYETVNLKALADTVGITKPALYRYFRGKEVLFLALFEEEMIRLKQSFADMDQSNDFGGAVAAIFVSRPLYCRLSAILHTVLERDLTYAEALSFKLSMKKEVMEIGQYLAKTLQITDEQIIFDMLMQIHSALIGCWHSTHPAGAVKNVLEREDMAMFNQSFEISLAKHLKAILSTS